MPEDLHEYILEQIGYGSVSEYFRSLVRREIRQRDDYRARPLYEPMRINDTCVLVRALDQLDKLRDILERKDTYDV